jgi:UDP-N-acetylenolpyruvoylglucosamine reductase
LTAQYTVIDENPVCCKFVVSTYVQITLENETLQVKSGGHETNPGFSSTPGVHISLKKFSEIDYDAQNHVVTVGAGLIWDDVYAALDPLGVGVVGGRVTGVCDCLLASE